MARINLKTGKLIKPQEFKGGNPEKQLQEYIEAYLLEFLQCYFLKNFYRIPGGEIDTLAISEDGIPCIIEYKHKKEETILNQIIFYYDWLSQKSAKFEFERLVKENDTTKNLNVDWTKIRLVCIAKKYSKWDISLVKHLDTDIECMTYNYHEDALDLFLDPIVNQYKKQRLYSSKETNIKEVTLEDHRNKADNEGKELLDMLRDKILELGDDVTEGYTPEYIKYFVNTTFLCVHVRKKWLILDFKVDGKSFKDAKKIAKDISHRKWTTNRELKLKDKTDVDYVIALIKQAYEYQK